MSNIALTQKGDEYYFDLCDTIFYVDPLLVSINNDMSVIKFPIIGGVLTKTLIQTIKNIIIKNDYFYIKKSSSNVPLYLYEQVVPDFYNMALTTDIHANILIEQGNIICWKGVFQDVENSIWYKYFLASIPKIGKFKRLYNSFMCLRDPKKFFEKQGFREIEFSFSYWKEKLKTYIEKHKIYREELL